MEDRYDIKFANVDGHTVSMFGVFDGIVLRLSFILCDSLSTMVMSIMIWYTRSCRSTCC
jgi:hypothetical protein